MFSIIFTALLIAQFVLTVAVDPMTGAWLSIAVTINYCLMMYFVFFNPEQVSISFNKRDNSIRAVYKLFIGDRTYYRQAWINQVEDVKYRAIKT